MVTKQNKWDEFISGAGAGITASFLVCPLDVVKTRKQFDYKGTLSSFTTVQTIRRIWAKEGFLQLYNGVLPSTIGYFSAWSVYFASYGALKEYFASENNSFPTVLVSSVLAGSISTTITSPIWVLRTKMMTNPQAKSLPKTFADTLRYEGIGAFYRGLLPSYFGLMHVAIQFPLYERLRDSTARQFKNDSLNVLYCSIVSKLIATLTTYPHEVLRTRLQTLKYSKYSNLTNGIWVIWKEEGLVGFYKGLSTTLVRVIPTTAIIFTTHHLILQWLRETA